MARHCIRLKMRLIVFSDEGDVTSYVPEGTWTHLLTGETVTGPRWVRERHGFLSAPLPVRPGAVLSRSGT
ncbi:hypothetical protein [Streptomyces indiaensis]|uniref:Uncharacterized protein n=1 Tax=Streptomyces indiaensis TaxID=284033 RepID=A0ABN3D9N4_9ACTN